MGNFKRRMSLPSGIIYTIVHSSRKTIAVEVKPTGEVIVRAPLRMTNSAAHAFALSKEEWIIKSLAKVKERQKELLAAVPPPFTGKEGEALPYLGGLLTVRRMAGLPEPEVMEDSLLLPAEYGLSDIIRWLRERAAKELSHRLAKYGRLLGVSWKSFRLSDARTRWGMCSGKNSINLSWRLIFCIPEAIDYVVSHELCHIKHKSHKREFYAELERVFPDRVRVERWLSLHCMFLNYL